MSDNASGRTRPTSWLIPVLILLALIAFGFWYYSGGPGTSPTSPTSEAAPESDGEETFIRFMNQGKSHYENGEAQSAVEAFQKAVELHPADTQARLNLANAHLLADQSEAALQQARKVRESDPDSPAAFYIIGCAQLRLGENEDALKALQQTRDIDPSVAAAHFQLGLAHQRLEHFEEAATAFEETLALEPDHRAANYNLSQVLRRLGRTDEANQAMQQHQAVADQQTNAAPATIATYERSVYTEVEVPFQLAQPAEQGISVTFADATQSALGEQAGQYRGPVGILDVNHRGTNDLFVYEPGQGFQLLLNTNGTFQPHGSPIPGEADNTYHRFLVADFQNDGVEDVLALGENASHLFKFATNGAYSDATALTGLPDLRAVDGALADLDFTGKLDLLCVLPEQQGVQVYRNLGNLYFQDHTQKAGIPGTLGDVRRLVMEDWNNDDLTDLFLLKPDGQPIHLAKERGGALYQTNTPSSWPAARYLALATTDLNNDLRPDMISVTDQGISCHYNGVEQPLQISADTLRVNQIFFVDYDNDGWTDFGLAGDGVRLWRNRGRSGFEETTDALRLSQSITGEVASVTAADLDADCDSDLLISMAGQGLKLLRNEGGNANEQLKLRLIGNRSNASGIGTRIEVTAGDLRTSRTVKQLPIEIGLGDRTHVDSITVRWFDLALSTVDTTIEQCEVLPQVELQLPTGSCPYLYAWDGDGFRFITDLLGAAPAGLPLSEDRLIEADPTEYVWIGDEQQFPAHNGRYLLQITEELREVLYLDQTHLAVVDHPPGTEIYPTDKLLPGKPYPPSELVALTGKTDLVQAMRLDGTDVTDRLRHRDQQMVSPHQVRDPQMRGLAEPHGVILDFGPLPADRPLVLALTGWLRFGGGMANISASIHPDLPFPFPKLEVETGNGKWQPVDVRFGAPAGKTKRIMVDLSGKLPEGSRRLRLTTAFELHWDHVALYERADQADVRVAELLPDQTDLHWRGYSHFEQFPWYLPLTPDYDRTDLNPHWRITPAGWYTRYGTVDKLIAEPDNAFVLMGGGDELTLAFDADRLPDKPEGYERDFFVYSVGWDKDADYHVRYGQTVKPYPFHGMDDQRYGEQPFPEGDHHWMEEYNTRWIGPVTLERRVHSNP